MFYSYALPFDSLYHEEHIQNVVFSGFLHDSTCKQTYGFATAFNPSQIDAAPVIVSSNLTWNNVPTTARIGTSILGFEVDFTNMGHHLLLIHDAQGFLLNTADNILSTPALRANINGQILFDNPNYVGSEQVCQEATLLGSRFYSCLSVPNTNTLSQFQQYAASWLDDIDQGRD